MSQATSLRGHSFLQQGRELVDTLLARFLPDPRTPPCTLHEAMRYSVMAGGKRLRPILALASWEHCGGERLGNHDAIHRAMAAIEMVHTYSLIHDDLPCMDDDDLRRGLPTCHRKFGEAVAVLAGDALHVAAFRLMAETESLRAVLELAEAIGTGGMLGGQIADIEAENRTVSRDEITNIHRRKTGALIRGSVRIGAILAETDESQVHRLTSYGEQVGLAFQIIDDILDIEGDQKLLGKQVGSDTRNQKATFPGVVGLEAARAEASQLIDAALAQFGPYEDNLLQYLARYIGQRER